MLARGQWFYLGAPGFTHLYLTLNYQKADVKIFVCKFSKHVKFKLHHVDNLKTRGQKV